MTTTSITSLSTVIGVFPDHDLADKAIDELRRTNFSYNRIRLVERGTGGFFETLKGLFTGQAEMASNTSGNLAKMGMPDYEAHYYQRELDADHVLLLMNADDRPEEAFTIMRQNGALDIHSRLRMAPREGSGHTRVPTGSSRENSYDRLQTGSRHNAQPMTASPDVTATSANPDGAQRAPDAERSQQTPSPNQSQPT